MIDLIIVLVLSLVMVPLAGFSVDILRIVFGLIFLLFLPGYALIAALFPRKSDIGGIERIALSFGLSIAIVPLIGLALNYTPWGIRLWPVLLATLAFIVVACAFAWYRRRKFSAEEQFSLRLQVSFSSLKNYWAGQNRWNKALNLLLALAILGSLGTLGYVASNPKIGESFTEFYVLGPGGKMVNYPRNATQGKSAAVMLGIANHEYRTETYRVEIVIGGQVTGAAGPVVLEHEQEWKAEVTFTPLNAGENQKVEFLLYTERQSEPYRSLHLWVDVKAPE